MKKLLTLLLSLAMILTTGTVAFAEEPTNPTTLDPTDEDNSSFDINVYAGIDVGEDTEEIGDPTYKVVVSWKMDGAIQGTKSGKTYYKWNDVTFAYDVEDRSNVVLTYDKDENEDDLNQTKVSIDFENKSDAAIKATIEYVPVEDGEQKACSMIFDPDKGDATASFNTYHKGTGHVIDSLFGYGLNERTFAAFDSYVLGLYKAEYAKNAVLIGGTNIDSLIDWLKTNGVNNPYKSKFIELNPQNAADLLKIAAGKNDFDDGRDNSDVLKISLPLTKSTPVYEEIVKLTDEGVDYVTKQTATNVNIGHFTVTVSTYNVR